MQFVVNYEEGAEQHSAWRRRVGGFLSEIVGAAPWPGMRHMNMESIYGCGSRAGFWRLHRLFTERSVPVTVYAVATAMARNREAVAAMNEAGWEIATHGLKWIDYRDTPPEVEALHIAEAVGLAPMSPAPVRSASIRAAPRSTPSGWPWRRAGRLLRRHLCRRSALLAGGTARPAAHDPLHARRQRHALRHPQGFNTGEQFYTYLKDSFDALYAEGNVAPKRLSIGLHCRLVGRPGRALALARYLDYALAHDRSGFQPGSISRGTGSPSTRRRAGGSRLSSPGRCSSNASAAFTNIRPGSRRLPRRWSVDRRHSGSAGEGARRRRSERDDRTEARADRGPSGFGRQALARQDADREIDAGAGERRARSAHPRRTAPVHRAQRRLSDAVRLSLHHGGQRQEHSRYSRRLQRRLANDADAETKTALAEIDRIAALRLKDILS